MAMRCGVVGGTGQGNGQRQETVDECQDEACTLAGGS
jgi:hypothetical protein